MAFTSSGMLVVSSNIQGAFLKAECISFCRSSVMAPLVGQGGHLIPLTAEKALTLMSETVGRRGR